MLFLKNGEISTDLHIYTTEVYLMLHERKNEIFKELFDSCLNLQYGKAKDYATDSDALSNFKGEDAKALGLTPFQKWGVYFGKQAMSILGAIGKSPDAPSTTSEPIEERIQDAIIYLVLLKCLLEDSKESGSEPKIDKSDKNSIPYSDRLKEIQSIKSVIDSDEYEGEKETPVKISISKQNNSGYIFTFSEEPNKLTENPYSDFYIYSENNTYYRYKCKPMRMITNNVYECIILEKRWWTNVKWLVEPFEESDIDTEGTWFLTKS